MNFSATANSSIVVVVVFTVGLKVLTEMSQRLCT